MAKGSRRHRSANTKKQKKKSFRLKNITSHQKDQSVVLPPKETKTDISYANLNAANAEDAVGKPLMTVIGGETAILMPGSSAYQTSFEKIYGKNPMAMKTGDSVEKTHNVLVFRDDNLMIPDLWLGVHLVGPPEDTKGFPHLFGKAMCHEAKTVEDADLVVFTGGPDVHPAYYGEEKHPSTYVNDERDHSDILVYLQCIEQGIPMVGVCRGAQFLAVMEGYKLYQHVDNHDGTPHDMWDCDLKMMVRGVSSVHHQMVMPGHDMEIIGMSNVSTEKWKNATKVSRTQETFPDVEAYFLRGACIFGVQGHPEYKGFNYYSKWFLDKIYNLIVTNPDCDWDKEKGGHLRVRQSLIDERLAAKLGDEETYVLGPNAPMIGA